MSRRANQPTAVPALALALAVTSALTVVLAGCGVRPTGVVTGGEPATGLTDALRVYYVHGTRLQGVSRPDTPITEAAGAMKLLAAGPTRAEADRGLVNLVEIGSYEVTGEGTRVTLRARGSSFGTDRARLSNGQLVCTLARAQSFLHQDRGIRTDDVQVTLDGDDGRLGPYRCSQFLTG
ncbi:hypothetical protein [Streptomyces sp. NPDC090025]|uniref:hypothetical protein n=1 Tax=Streptomyces sp. NPDC090025 TaxID=3365922 RepID=UPI003838CE00